MIRSFVLLCLWCCAMPGVANATPAPRAPVILVWGDSLSAAYGIDLERGWVALLQQRLRAEGHPHRVVNGSVSGETTAGGLARLPAALERHRPSLLLIELGANDGLRGLSLAQMRANLAAMVRLAGQAGARSAIFEMRIPSNYGAYAERFRRSFADVAAASGAVLVPFFLEGFALDEGAFQADGIHPSAAVQPRMLEAVWPHLKPLLAATDPDTDEEPNP